MKYRNLTNTTKISLISIGCWQFGTGLHWGDSDKNELIHLVYQAIDKGVNLFDTAALYNNGQSEEILGEALKGKRKNVLISTKILSNQFDYKTMYNGLTESLKRLNTDYVDIYYIHWPKTKMEQTDYENIFNSFDKLIKQGMVKYAGLSNFRKYHLVNFDQNQLKIFKCNQVPYSLLWRYYDVDGTTDFCRQNHISLFAYSPLMMGLLAGKFNQNKENIQGDARTYNILFKEPYYTQALKIVEEVKKISLELKCNPSHIALKWAIDNDIVVSAISGMRKIEHLENNLKSIDVEIPIEKLDYLNKISLEFQKILPPDIQSMWG